MADFGLGWEAVARTLVADAASQLQGYLDAVEALAVAKGYPSLGLVAPQAANIYAAMAAVPDDALFTGNQVLVFQRVADQPERHAGGWMTRLDFEVVVVLAEPTGDAQTLEHRLQRHLAAIRNWLLARPWPDLLAGLAQVTPGASADVGRGLERGSPWGRVDLDASAWVQEWAS